jgi:hypothetical protein
MTTRTYDPALVNVSFSGIPLSGFAPDTFLKATRSTDAFALKIGAGGEAARALSRDRSGEVTLTLMATSQSNDLLSAIANADEQSGQGVGALFIKELNGTTLLMAESAWVKKMPDLERGTDIATVEWVFTCADLTVFLGGLV